MATKPLKTLTFEGLDDTYTVPQIDASLSTTGKAADAKVTGDTLAEKADKDGVIATAEGLIGGAYTVEKEPYHFRKTAVDLAGRLDETIVGGSLGWNQLVDTTTLSSSTLFGFTFTPQSDGSIKVNGTRDTSGTAYYRISEKYSFGDHVVFLMGTPITGSSTAYHIYQDSNNNSVDIGNGCIYKQVAQDKAFYIRVSSYTESMNNVIFKPQVIDLTTLFGSTIADYIYTLEQSTAGAGVAWVKRYIDLDTYHEYDAGSIQSVEGLESHDVVGFNQFDESNADFVDRYYIDENGNAASSANYKYSNAYTEILPNTEYALTLYKDSDLSLASRIVYYDANKTFLGRSDSMTTSTARGVYTHTFTTINNAKYVRLDLPKDCHDICINLSDPSRNGTYEPYEKHSYPLDSSLTLRGVPKLVTDHIEFDGDKYRSDGTVERRYGIVDLGSLTWARETITGRFYAPLSDAEQTEGKAVPGIVCAKYIGVTSYGQADNENIFISSGHYVSIWDSAYSDATAFKIAMSGVMLVYELATPTTETAQPFQSPMIVGATEEYVSDSVVPVGHESRYYEDVAKKVNGLPKDFSTLIAPTEVTFTATRNYSVGSYLIVKNQLYKVTSAISSGGTITPNSNVTATTIMAEILALA